MRKLGWLPGAKPVVYAGLALAFLLSLFAAAACSDGHAQGSPDAGTDADAATGSDADGDGSTASDADGDGSTASDAGPDGSIDGDGDYEVACIEGVAEGDFPERVIFRSKTTSFNWRWYVSLHDGKIWVKPNTEAGELPGEWTLLGSGLPAGIDVVRFDPPTEIVEISADGTWLQALSSAGVFYRGTDFTGDVHASFTWSDDWGHPAATGPGITTEFPTAHGWAVSDSQGAGVDHYEDRLGTSHSVGMGVAHMYRIGAEGRTLIFNDWWLPADWSRQICLPDRGTFFAENMSASASTVFIVGALGELYTRLYDFDTGGENDTLIYSFLITAAAGDTRALPAEDWRRQPDITDGLITSQNHDLPGRPGERRADAARRRGPRRPHGLFLQAHLRPELVLRGDRTPGLRAPPQRAGPDPPGPVAPKDYPLVGTLARSPAIGESVSVDIEIPSFNLMCSPAEAYFRRRKPGDRRRRTARLLAAPCALFGPGAAGTGVLARRCSGDDPGRTRPAG